jgi:hypothetical protein
LAPCSSVVGFEADGNSNIRSVDVTPFSVAGKKAGRVERVSVRNSDDLGRLAYSFNEMAISFEKSEKAKRQMIAKGFLIRGNQLRNSH